MAKVEIMLSLREEIYKKFKEDSTAVFEYLKLIETNPKRGKALTHIGVIVIKELKYGSFRFYFITNGHILKFGTKDDFATLLIKFVRMSEKKDQKKVIAEIKETLLSFGFGGL